jgi:hypothetical protein
MREVSRYVKTSAGRECRYFYADYHRGRHHETCRLLEESEIDWEPGLCKTCPVPDILLANACPNMVLYGRIVRRMGLWKRVRPLAVCMRTRRVVVEPKVGCGLCGQPESPE